MIVRTIPEIKAFLAYYAKDAQINHFLLNDKEQAKAMKTGMVRLEFVGELIIWKRK